MALDDLFGNVETEAQANAGSALHFDSWHAVEALEDIGQLGLGDARPLVAHRELHSALVTGDRQGDRRAKRGIFERIREQVCQHLTDTVDIYRYLDRLGGGFEDDVTVSRGDLLVNDLV